VTVDERRDEIGQRNEQSGKDHREDVNEDEEEGMGDGGQLRVVHHE